MQLSGVRSEEIVNFSQLSLVVACLVGLFFGGCGTVLTSVPITQKGDSWTITLLELRDGPNGYTRGNITYKPGRNQRFLWVTASFRNDAPAGRDFSYDACALDADDEVFLPVIVDRALFANAPTDGVEPYQPGEERKRRLAFSYPDDRMPPRLRCGASVFAFPRAVGRVPE
jgi:hypothetical protein